jgi:hypothetical protein
MCVRCGTGRIAWCTDPYRHGESAEPVSPGDPPVVTRRLEDRNSAQMFDAFPDGMTLAELEAFVRQARDRGAPDDACPRVKLNEHGEVIGMVCLTARNPELNEIIDRNARP